MRIHRAIGACTFVLALLLPSFVSAQPVGAYRTTSALMLASASLDRTPAEAAMMYYDDNPVVEVARSTMWGAIGGTILGLAAALVVEDGGEAVKWGFVAGTFGGFIWGVVYATGRSDPGNASMQTTARIPEPAPASGLLYVPGEVPGQGLSLHLSLLRITLGEGSPGR